MQQAVHPSYKLLSMNKIIQISLIFTVARSWAAGPAENRLSEAVKSRKVQHVRMLLQNTKPDFQARFQPNNETLFWQALFSQSGYPLEDQLPFTPEQKQIAEQLLAIDPGLIDLPVLNPPQSPLTYLFTYYSRLQKLYGKRGADGIRDRIQFLREKGARFEGDYVELKRRTVELPQYLGSLDSDVLELGLQFGLNPNGFYFERAQPLGERRRTLLATLTELAVTNPDKDASEIAFEKVRLLLKYGANPRIQAEPTEEGSDDPLFFNILVAWEATMKFMSQPDDPILIDRFKSLYRMFFEYGISPDEPLPTRGSSILKWTSRKAGVPLIHNFFKEEACRDALH